MMPTHHESPPPLSTFVTAASLADLGASVPLPHTHSKALRRRIAADLAQIEHCQQGEHVMQATQSPGVVICHFCRTLGVCPRCGVIPPAGACLQVCPTHTDLPVNDEEEHPQ